MIIKFPGEEETIATIQSNLKDRLEFAERIYKFWITGNPRPKRKMTQNVFDLSKMLNLQALRLFRTALEETYRGEAIGASIASRSLFETVIAILFILKPGVRIIVAPELDQTGKHKHTQHGKPKYIAKPPDKKYVRNKKDLLTQYHRASLYLAHATFDQDSFADKCLATKGFERFSNFTEKPDPALIAACEKAIGPEWSHIIRHRPHTYSGLNVATLAELLDPALRRYYDTIYHIQSRIVHGVDALRMATLDSDGKPQYACFSPMGFLIGTLTTATMGLLCCIMIIHKYLDLGSTVRLVLREFNKEFQRLHRA